MTGCLFKNWPQHISGPHSSCSPLKCMHQGLGFLSLPLELETAQVSVTHSVNKIQQELCAACSPGWGHKRQKNFSLFPLALESWVSILTLPCCGESTQIHIERTEEPQVFQPPVVQVCKCGITCRIRFCTPAICNWVTAWGDLTEKPVANASNHQMHEQKKWFLLFLSHCFEVVCYARDKENRRWERE